jgi:hypothetical protein
MYQEVFGAAGAKWYPGTITSYFFPGANGKLGKAFTHAEVVRTPEGAEEQH